MEILPYTLLQKGFFKKRLTIFGLALYTCAIFLPWIVETYGYRGRYWSPGYGSVYFWSFMALHKDRLFFLEDFWFNQKFGFFLDWYSTSAFFGLYLGWILVAFCQIVTLILVCSEWFRWGVPFQEWRASGIVMLPVLTLVLALYQRIMQYEMTYQSDIPVHSVEFSWGFWLAAISVAMLFISILSSPERLQFKRWRAFWKKSLRNTVLLAIPLCIVGFSLFNEFHFQTGVTKAMYIQRKVSPQEVPCDPQFWEADFNEILAVADLFRARMRYNSPEYCYCSFEVPLVSYRIFAAILHSKGYIAREPIFLHFG